MIRLLLVRHGLCDPVGKSIAGRAASIHLNGEGIDECRILAETIGKYGIDQVFASPLERTLETAEILVQPFKMRVRADDRLNEIAYGEWTGLTFEKLPRDDRWHRFNASRSSVRIPGGEHILEVQARMAECAEEVRREYDGQTVLLVSHGDPLKCLLSYYCGFPLDNVIRLTIETASLSMISVDDYGPSIEFINYKPPRPGGLVP